MREKKVYESCRRLLTVCADCKKDEKILIVTDDDCLEIGLAIWDAAEEFPNKSMILMPTRKMHGEEPTDLVAAAMLEADVIFRATKFSLSHSFARRRACENGARDLNCCDYDIAMLEHGGLYNDFFAGESRRFVDRMPKTASVFDSVINPPKTETILAGERNGLNTVPGMQMLVSQMDVIFKFLFDVELQPRHKAACVAHMCEYLGVQL